MGLGRFRALVIAVADYQDPLLPDLETPVNDALALQEILSSRYGFSQVELLLDGEAGRENIDRAFRELVRTSVEDESLLIYFAGHGILDQILDVGYWLPWDAVDGEGSSYIQNVLVRSYISKLKAKHVLLISDSCFSGTFVTHRHAAGTDNPQNVREKLRLPSRQVVTSGSLQPVSDSGADGHSIFAYHLLKLLRENKAQYIMADVLCQEIGTLVSESSQQTPLCNHLEGLGDRGGSFIFKSAESLSVAKQPPNGRPTFAGSPQPSLRPIPNNHGRLSVETNPPGAVVLRTLAFPVKQALETPFEIDLPAGNHEFILFKPGYRPSPQHLYVIPHQRMALGPVLMEPLGEQRSLSGKVSLAQIMAKPLDYLDREVWVHTRIRRQNEQFIFPGWSELARSRTLFFLEEIFEPLNEAKPWLKIAAFSNRREPEMLRVTEDDNTFLADHQLALGPNRGHILGYIASEEMNQISPSWELVYKMTGTPGRASFLAWQDAVTDPQNPSRVYPLGFFKIKLSSKYFFFDKLDVNNLSRPVVIAEIVDAVLVDQATLAENYHEFPGKIRIFKNLPSNNFYDIMADLTQKSAERHQNFEGYLRSLYSSNKSVIFPKK